jgi:hypothetical protein
LKYFIRNINIDLSHTHTHTHTRALSQALVDGYLVPIRLHPAFFALLRSIPLDSSLYLASEASHLSGDMRASHTAKLFSIFPQVKAIYNSNDDIAVRKEALNKLLSVAYSFTGGLTLEEWLEMLSFSEPITRTALPQSKHDYHVGEVSCNEEPSTCTVEWDSTVNGSNLYAYLTQLEDLWLGEGVRQQVLAFQEGFADMADDNSGSLAFMADELRCSHI